MQEDDDDDSDVEFLGATSYSYQIDAILAGMETRSHHRLLWYAMYFIRALNNLDSK